jgi:transposase-like protein
VFRELSVAEQRYQAVLAVIEDGAEMTAVAEKFGVRRQTVHSWLSRCAEGGLKASPAACRDRGYIPPVGQCSLRNGQ